jgi:uncharacterized LabA/DUF88 family protein
MTSLIQERQSAVAYIDYENIFELMRMYGVNPIEINFFPVLLDRFKNVYNLKIISVVAYSNFEKKLQGRHQSLLQGLGVETRHSASNGKNFGDLQLTVDALTTLFKNSAIEVFIIISSDRDIIPLLKAIKYENKTTVVLTTKNGFNGNSKNYADLHEFIEDIFNLTPQSTLTSGEIEETENYPSYKALDRAEELARLFLASNILKRSETDGRPITLKGYADTVACVVQRDTTQIIKDFQLASELGLVEIYQHSLKGLCLRRAGGNSGEPRKNQ